MPALFNWIKNFAVRFLKGKYDTSLFPETIVK